MSIGWAPDMIGWACAQPFPTLATPLNRDCPIPLRGWEVYIACSSHDYHMFIMTTTPHV